MEATIHFRGGHSDTYVRFRTKKIGLYGTRPFRSRFKVACGTIRGNEFSNRLARIHPCDAKRAAFGDTGGRNIALLTMIGRKTRSEQPYEARVAGAEMIFYRLLPDFRKW